MTQSVNLDLGLLPSLGELFDAFNAGKHLNRTAEPALWAELESEQKQYQELFGRLGFNLCVDRRGFAWFQFDNASSNVSRTTRQLALLFMLLFEMKADEGMHLHRFADWSIDRSMLAKLFERGHDLLLVEGMDEEALATLLDRACAYGFVETAAGGWRLLSAIWRYLDHFEVLANERADKLEEGIEDDESIETSAEEERA
jgi:hypothetical protein